MVYISDSQKDQYTIKSKHSSQPKLLDLFPEVITIELFM